MSTASVMEASAAVAVPGLALLVGEVVQRRGEVGQVGGGVGLGQARWMWTASVMEASAASRSPVLPCWLDRLFSDLARSGR